ncbi:MAG: hypothetical protein PHQ28_10270 [Mycobacterium sp.]|nr:hypothetical protein [Mycobacterium sp.]
MYRRHGVAGGCSPGRLPYLGADLVAVDDIGLLPVAADAAEGL